MTNDEVYAGQGYKWKITFYYLYLVAFPKVPGGMAIQILCRDDLCKETELAAMNQRDDIGRIEVRKL